MCPMQNRFTFIEDEIADWHIDERTKVVGRQGIAAARLTLEAIRKSHDVATAA
jgi:hypothetical protein